MTLPTVTPSLSPEPDLIRSGSDPSGSGVGSKDEIQVGPFRSPSPESGWSLDFEEQDRIRAARAFVNHAADIALRQSLGDLCVKAVCGKCGIGFLAMTKRDDRCHVCVNEAPR